MPPCSTPPTAGRSLGRRRRACCVVGAGCSASIELYVARRRLARPRRWLPSSYAGRARAGRLDVRRASCTRRGCTPATPEPRRAAACATTAAGARPCSRLRDAGDAAPGAPRCLVAPLAPGRVGPRRLPAAHRAPRHRRRSARSSVELGRPVRPGRARRSTAAGVTELTVYPHIDEIVAAAPRRRATTPTAGADHPNALGRAGEDFYALRAYVVGDDLRRVHWPLDGPARRAHGPPGRAAVAGPATRAARRARAATHRRRRSSSRSRPRPASSPPRRRRRTSSAWSPPTAPTPASRAGHAHVEAIMEHLASVGPTAVPPSTPSGPRRRGPPPAGRVVAVVSTVDPAEVDRLRRLAPRGSATCADRAVRRPGVSGVPKATADARAAAVKRPGVMRGRRQRGRSPTHGTRRCVSPPMPRRRAGPPPPRPRQCVRRGGRSTAGPARPGATHDRHRRRRARHAADPLERGAESPWPPSRWPPPSGSPACTTAASFLPAAARHAPSSTHALCAVGRRRRWSVPVAGLLSAPAWRCSSRGWSCPHTARYGLPTTDTLDAIGRAVTDGVARVPAVTRRRSGPSRASCSSRSPAAGVRRVPGRLGRASGCGPPSRPWCPPATLFVFCSACGRRPAPAVSVASPRRRPGVPAGAPLGPRGAGTGGWSTTAPGGGPHPGGAMRAVAVLIGVAVRRRRPARPAAARRRAIRRCRPRPPPAGHRLTVSPLVDIREPPGRPADMEVFTVEEPRPSYWRLTSLDTFDGDRSGGRSGSYAEAPGRCQPKTPRQQRHHRSSRRSPSPTLDDDLGARRRTSPSHRSAVTQACATTTTRPRSS